MTVLFSMILKQNYFEIATVPWKNKVSLFILNLVEKKNILQVSDNNNVQGSMETTMSSFSSSEKLIFGFLILSVFELLRF